MSPIRVAVLGAIGVVALSWINRKTLHVNVKPLN